MTAEKRHTDYGSLPIKITGMNEDGDPIGIQNRTGKKVCFPLYSQNEGHARHAVNADCTLIAAMFNRGMLGRDPHASRCRLDAAEEIQSLFENTGNRQPMCGSYSPIKGEGHAEATPEEMAASIRYHKALDAMDSWERRVVRKVCIDDQMVDGLDLQHLVSGLDALVRHFGK